MRWAVPLLVFSLVACSGRSLLLPSSASSPSPLAGAPASLGATRLAIGSHHACALRADGTVRCWGGDNGYGQLGDGTLVAHATPAPVATLGGIVAIAAGLQSTCALDRDGAVWCWGENTHGECGDRTFLDRSTPVRVPIPPAEAVFASMTTACARLRAGQVRCWGDLPSRGGEPRAWGGSWPAGTPQPTPLDGATAITASIGTVCGLLADGHARCWGQSQLGELGTPPSAAATTADIALGADDPPATALASGTSLECAVVNSGSVRCWGFAARELGVPAVTPVATAGGGAASATTGPGPVGLVGAVELVGDDDALCARAADGTVSCIGSQGIRAGPSTVWLSTTASSIPALAGASQLVAGPNDVCVRHADGRVTCVARVDRPRPPTPTHVHGR